MLRSIPGFIRVADPAEISPERFASYPGTTIVVVNDFVFDNTWVLCPDKPCRLRLPGKNHYCRRPSVAAIKRTNGLWAYCADHLYGRVLVDGRLETHIRVEDERLEHHLSAVGGGS